MAAVIIAVLSLVILFGWSATPFAKMRLFPAPLAVVALGTGLNALFSVVAPQLALSSTHLVTLPVPAAAADWLQQFAFPAWSAITNPVVWRVGVTLGIVASPYMESASAVGALTDSGLPESSIEVHWVPGSFELPQAAARGGVHPCDAAGQLQP